MTMMPPQAADDVSAGAEMMLLVSLAVMRCLPSCARRHTSLPQATSCAKHASFARQGKHHSKKLLLSEDKRSFFAGGGCRIRTRVDITALTVFKTAPL